MQYGARHGAGNHDPGGWGLDVEVGYISFLRSGGVVGDGVSYEGG